MSLLFHHQPIAQYFVTFIHVCILANIVEFSMGTPTTMGIRSN
ncbi:hypothetical protein QX776_10505 [Alteromonadaceae bacterium BrNp21-10]|nr:hypothetical protein [Alteromonadaceae bacterium BrNp21-10]